VHPREVFKEAIKRSAAAVILIHNHPSGIPEPSQDDIKLTRRLAEAGEILGIDVLDHIIIGDGIYLSMKEKAYF
ncbi:MAG TPA: JAB domain-containing protein, partial [Halanaerobiales bacterium]|nr:JAB domain-containing protein [Halanaerobiales bacterium]